MRDQWQDSGAPVILSADEHGQRVICGEMLMPGRQPFPVHERAAWLQAVSQVSPVLLQCSPLHRAMSGFSVHRDGIASATPVTGAADGQWVGVHYVELLYPVRSLLLAQPKSHAPFGRRPAQKRSLRWRISANTWAGGCPCSPVAASRAGTSALRNGLAAFSESIRPGMVGFPSALR